MPKFITCIAAMLVWASTVVAQQAPFTLSEQEQRNLDLILVNWQARSQSIKTMEAKFQKFKYDIAGAPADQYAAYSDGLLKYMSPDRGMFKEENIQFFNGVGADGKATYKVPTDRDGKPTRFGEWWVCTGTELVFMNRETKECRIDELPPNMQGQQLFDSPLPFVFNLDAEKMKQRFWIRQVAPPPGRTNEYWLEVYPKMQKDAQLYKVVQVVLGAKDLLPQVLIIYPSNYDVAKNPSREIYEFKDVKVNHVNMLERATALLFKNEFINPQPPSNDWKVIRQPPPAAQQPLQTAEQPQPGRPAAR